MRFKITVDIACHCEEPFGFAQDKLRDEAISTEFQGLKDCFASPRLPSGGQVAMTSYIASIFRNHSASALYHIGKDWLSAKAWVVSERGYLKKDTTESGYGLIFEVSLP